MDDEGLEVSLADMLKAFELAGPYATGKNNTLKLENRKEIALCLIDWALMEGDRGLKLLELTSEMAMRDKGGGTIIVGPIG